MKKLKKWVSGLLAFCIMLSLLPVSVHAQTEQDISSSTETVETFDLPELETSAVPAATFSLDSNGVPAIKSTREVKWIDRLATLPSYATGFYSWLEENSDGDGQSDALIDPTTGENADGSYVYNVVDVTSSAIPFTYEYGASDSEIQDAAEETVMEAISDKQSEVLAYIVAVYSAFDRDCPEVFWLSGASQCIIGHSNSFVDNGDGTGTVSYNLYVDFVLQSSDFDIRTEEYQSAGTIRSAIAARDDAVEAITEEAAGSRYAKVRYLNQWLTKNNCYNTSEDLDGIDWDCRNCIGALTGSTGTDGPVCEGYARAFKVLCDDLSIPCVLVNGTATNSSGSKAHMWNYVQMEDGNWYAVDVTWNDPSVDGVSSAESEHENEDYLLVGSQTVIDQRAFINSHPVSNTVNSQSTAFTNGPELAENKYQVKPAVIDGSFGYYSEVSGADATYTFHYDENWFFEDSDSYNHELAQMSIRMAMAAARTGATSIQDLLNQLEFSKITTHYPTPTTQTIGYAIGSKTVTDTTGETFTLIAVAIRGGGYKSEWASNATVGTTSEHEGFSQAAGQVLDGIEAHIAEIGANENIKIWITGYSRAAATANLTAHQLNWDARNNRIAGLSETGIFAYCFACPMGVRKDHPSYSTKDNNIFNIVNPNDLVTMVAPDDWNFSRYGITYYLPSNEVNYNDFSSAFSGMKTQYGKIISGMDTDKSVSELTAYSKSQYTNFNNAVEALASYFIDQNTYVIGYQSDLANTLASFNGAPFDVGAVVELILADLPAFPVLHPGVTIYLGANLGKISTTHYPEQYMAWLDSLDGDELKKDARTRYLVVNCPVDISVYDSDGILVAQIVDDTVQQIEDSTIGALMDENGQKIVILPCDEEFEVAVTATADGQMSYQLQEYDIDAGSATRVVNYFDIEIEAGDELVGTVGVAEADASAVHVLVGADGAEIAVDSELTADEIENLTVTVTAEGSGTVSGGGYFVTGEYAMVTAQPDENKEFLGWYVNDTLVSQETEYRFCVESDVSIVGRFSTEHVHDYQSTVTPPTCTQPGYTTHTCTACGDSYVDTLTDVAEHDFGQWYTTKEATCTLKGEEQRDCVNCDAFETQDIEATGHNYISGQCTACGEEAEILEGLLEGDFIYSVTGGIATITNYVGTGGDVTVPGEIGGYPVVAVDRFTFYENDTIRSITIGEGIQTLSSEWAYRCSSLETISFPSTFSMYGGSGSGLSGVPLECYNLKTLTVAEDNENVTVYNGALYDKEMTALLYYPSGRTNTVLTIPEGVVLIGNSACEGAIHLEQVRMPDTVESIGYWAFCGCRSLETINLSQSCTFIGQYAFNGTVLRSIHIPAALTGILQPVFFGTNLEQITVDPQNPVYSIRNGSLYLTESDCLVKYPDGSSAFYYEIPEDTRSIAWGAFDNAFTSEYTSGILVFNGDAPAINEDNFCNINATAYYPANNDTWTEELVEEYSQLFQLNWVQQCQKHDFEPYELAADCYSPGYSGERCTVCRFPVIDEIVDALGHDMGAWQLYYGNTEYRTCNVCGEYEFREVAVPLEAPVVTVSNDATSGKIKITWEAVDGAVKYQLYRSTDKENWTKLITTTGTSVTNTSAVAGTLYYYKVKAIASDSAADSEFSAVVSRCCDLPCPVITLSNIASSGKVKVAWEAVDGAVKYQVYRSTDNKNWTKLITTTGTSLTNTSAVAGTLYYYKVKAIASNSAANSAFSTVKSRRCDLPRPVLTLSNIASSGKIKISWEAVDGAVKYQVYRSTDNQNWAKLITTTGTSVTNTSAVAGTLYYYKVMAIASNSAANSAFSVVNTRTCDLPRPALTVTLSSQNKPYLAWTKIGGAVKYEVYYSTDNQNWIRLITTTGTKLNHASAVSGMTYYYKVRAMGSVTSANSAYSTVNYITAQ